MPWQRVSRHLGMEIICRHYSLVLLLPDNTGRQDWIRWRQTCANDQSCGEAGLQDEVYHQGRDHPSKSHGRTEQHCDTSKIDLHINFKGLDTNNHPRHLLDDIVFPIPHRCELDDIRPSRSKMMPTSVASGGFGESEGDYG
jgi:hypothetical protein